MTTLSSQTRSLLSQIVGSLGDATLAVTSDGRLVCANDPARNIFPGLRDGDAISRIVRAPELLGALHEAHGKPVRRKWLMRVPFEREFDLHVAPLGPDFARVKLVSLHETTETRRAERMRAEFVANASHELRTPLASLIGFVETLQGPARDDTAAREQFLTVMGEQARRMSRVIDDLLSLARVERRAHLRPQTPVDLGDIAATIAASLSRIADEAGARLVVHAPAPVIVAGDRDELLRVAENLIENAIKYGGPGLVTISVGVEHGRGSLTVEDRGPGIAPEHIPRLTERFYRVDATASRAKGGTGLGLAIVKHIVARHRGRLSISSHPENGTRFSAFFPLAAS